MTTTSPFRYVDRASQYPIKGAFVAVLPRTIDSKSALLEALATLLAFPAYFGFNWDALFDCLRDFSWITEQDIVLVHLGLPVLPEQQLRIYLRLLRDSVLNWRPGEAHRFDVVFAESDQKTVEGLLREE